jgi:hypothetical protein
MKLTLTFKLTRPAKKAGGDRYETLIEGEAKPMVIYVPQKISRPEGAPSQSLTVTIE